MPYVINTEEGAHRDAVGKWLVGLDLVSPEIREKILTAWVTMWTSGPFRNRALPEIPALPVDIDFSLMQHVNEVTAIGLDLARISEREWKNGIDYEILVPILVLHDVDKPLIYDRIEGHPVEAPIAQKLPHGVPGAMLLNELGFSLTVVHTVCTHSQAMPFQGRNHESFLLHYADYLSVDHAWSKSGRTPMFFSRRG